MECRGEPRAVWFRMEKEGFCKIKLENVDFAVGKGGEGSGKSRTKPWKRMAREQGASVNASVGGSLEGKRQSLIFNEEVPVF
ncbi:hypothetical protein SLEP1_g3106 [Rubroshorea leprosula]|uniref:Uncharacterized protein n=1 Tax=Rubroshorea leprosula TaxID=152421 RepID=A0AAV5HSK3_9ROSI|nr:hypothetical protein SLEP1_g3106 [Rubroshorea leprosula]